MIKTYDFQYSDPITNELFEGVISWNSRIKGKKPGILVAHAYRGQGALELLKTKQLAQLGYVGFAIDMYGKGIRASSPEEAQMLMDNLDTNRPLLLRRILLALENLKMHEEVDPSRIGAIGFCFGGKCVLDLARSGAEIDGVASFHGLYDAPKMENNTAIKASILVLHGWEDPLANPESVAALGNELTARNADWQIVVYGNTGHAFTNPSAKSRETGLFFQADSNSRAWQSMENFFEELFKKTKIK